MNLGVAYQLVEDDPLVDEAQCQRDATLMQQLGANSIRVYHVDPNADHSGCMNAFAQVGVYAWVDLDSFKTYIRLVSKQENLRKALYSQSLGQRAFLDTEQVG